MLLILINGERNLVNYVNLLLTMINGGRLALQVLCVARTMKILLTGVTSATSLATLRKIAPRKMSVTSATRYCLVSANIKTG